MTAPIDRDRIDDATGGDLEFLKELVEIFLDDTKLRFVELNDELTKGDAEAIGRTAHKVKGSSANMGATVLMKRAHELEQMGKGGDISGAPEAVKALEAEFARVEAALTELAGSLGPPP